MLTENNSGQGGVEAQEDPPALPGTDTGANRDVGTANQLDRVGEYQQGDVGGDGEGRRGHEADSWQAYAWQGGRDNVCICIEYQYRCVGNGADGAHRDKLREQNDLSEEIVQAITGNQLGEPVDDMELEDELEAMQQEHLDEQMLKTGNVPTTDAVAHKMPSPAQQERKWSIPTTGIWEVTRTDTKQLCQPRNRPWRTTKRQSWRSCAPKWPCSRPLDMHVTKRGGLQLGPLTAHRCLGITKL